MDGRFHRLHRMCQDAVTGGVTPGLELLLALQGRVVFHEAFGMRQLEPELLDAERGTIWDVASITKAAVTSVLAMQLVSAGKLTLEAPAMRWIPELCGGGKEHITLRHLLSHASGLPPHRPFHRAVAEAPDPRAHMVRLAAAEPLESPPGAASRYSDLGFILLGALIERLTGTRLDRLFESRVAGPLNLSLSRFVDLSQADEQHRLLRAAPVAATQRCAERGRVLMGEVDDHNAHAMGGVAGHAGLFSTASELSTLAGALTAAWRGERDAMPGVERDVVREFWHSAGVPGSTWRLGWDGPSAHGSLAGELLSRRAVGHLGFTGCSLWIDPESATWVVLLTNRVHPVVRDDPRFRALRPAIHDEALRAAGYASS